MLFCIKSEQQELLGLVHDCLTMMMLLKAASSPASSCIITIMQVRQLSATSAIWLSYRAKTMDSCILLVKYFALDNVVESNHLEKRKFIVSVQRQYLQNSIIQRIMSILNCERATEYRTEETKEVCLNTSLDCLFQQEFVHSNTRLLIRHEMEHNKHAAGAFTDPR